jgi:hypothetical protein
MPFGLSSATSTFQAFKPYASICSRGVHAGLFQVVVVVAWTSDYGVLP